MRTKNCSIAKPKPIRETAVRSHDIIVRSTLSRVRIQPKWVSAVTRTSSRGLPISGSACDMPASPLSVIDVARLAVPARPDQRNACHEASKDHIRQVRQQQRDDKRFNRMEVFEHQELVD